MEHIGNGPIPHAVDHIAHSPAHNEPVGAVVYGVVGRRRKVATEQQRQRYEYGKRLVGQVDAKGDTGVFYMPQRQPIAP